MKLTPGEREAIGEVERKISKPIFRCGIRVVYLGKKSVWFKPNFRLALNFFNNFSNPELNSLAPWGKTVARVHKSPFVWFNQLIPRLTYVKKRRVLRVFRGRDNYLTPLYKGDLCRFVLNAEELATLFHFPSAIVAPTPGLRRTEAKETVAPHNLPT